ncbi:MAG: CRISPR-associated helicase Cas3' [Candidatus Lokiarchaeota archaeon]|nr:CRISPR-associated helicase Cas3' [Candidatus Lokiarchaeota archaeon]
MDYEIIARPGQPLYDHLKQVFQISIDRLNLINLNIDPILKELTQFSLEIICLTHDIGKATKFFQNWINQEKKLDGDTNVLRNHSLFSSIFTLATFIVLEDLIRVDLKNKTIGSINYSCLYRHFAFLSQLIVRSHHGDLKDLSIIYNQDFDEEIVVRHKKRLEYCYKEYIAKLYKELILPNIIKSNSIIEIKNIQENKTNFDKITDRIFNVIEIILNDRSFRFKKLYHDLYLNKGKIIGIPKYCSYEVFFLGKLMNSILLDSDKMNSVIGLGFPISDNLTTKQFNKNLKNYLLKKRYMIPEENFQDNLENLNTRRRYILNKIDKSIENENIISLLSVPTGFGKTFSGLYYASGILSPRSNVECSNFFQINPRLIYALPFLSIIEQVERIMEKFLQQISEEKEKTKNTTFLVHHHLTEPIFKLDDDQEYDESTAELFIKSWNSQYILSTFNQLLNALFKTDKDSAIKFSKIINNTWILDEIQSIPLKYWKILEEFLLLFNNLFYVNILIMSATIPKIINLKSLNKNITSLKNNYRVNELITTQEYQKLLYNINRINLEYYGSISFESFLEKLINLVQDCKEQKKNLLIVLNTRKSAQYVFNYIKNSVSITEYKKEKRDPIYIEFLAATQTPIKKSRVIKKIKTIINYKNNNELDRKNKNIIILISTQCIEAGIDIDFDIVVRDFAPFDNIIQVAGRCNRNDRNNLSKGIVKIYKIMDENSKNNKYFCQYIYDAHLLRITDEIFQKIHDPNIYPYIYNENEIYSLTSKYYENIENFFKEGSMEEIKSKYEDYILNYKYKSLSQDFKLIAKLNPFSIFIEEDEKSAKIIENYKSLVKSMKDQKNKNNFPKELYNKLLRTRKELQSYLITAYLNKEEQEKLNKIDRFGDLYIISKKNLENFYSNEIGFFIN